MRIALTFASLVLLAGCSAVPKPAANTAQPLDVQRAAAVVHQALDDRCASAASSWADQCLSLDPAHFGAVRSFDVVEAERTPQGAVFYAEVSLANTQPGVLTVDCEYRAGVLVPKNFIFHWPSLQRRNHIDSPMPPAKVKISS
jgi:hypothetical protein